jgi:hypothetical protein
LIALKVREERRRRKNEKKRRRDISEIPSTNR